MALGKAAKELAEAAAKAAGKVDGAARTARPINRVVDASNTQQLQQATDDLFAEFNATKQQSLEEYQASINTQVEPTIEEISRAGRLADAARTKERALVRDARLFESNSDVDYTFQTSTPEEFKTRLLGQLADPTFGTRAIMDNDFDATLLETVRGSLFNDAAFQTHMSENVLTGRIKARADAWRGDSPYKSVYVHVDRQSDPLRQQGNLVQFEFPRELGAHSGTNQASVQATIKSPSRSMQQIDDFDVLLDEMAGHTQNPKEFKNRFARTVEQFFIQKFSQGRIYDNDMWDELLSEMTGVIKELGGNPKDAGIYIGRAKQLPTANSTPHLFRGRKGLYLKDNGGFGPDEVAAQLAEIFPDKSREIIAAREAGGTVKANKALQKFIEAQGFDHVVYHNSVEDRGTLSIINWNADLWAPLYGEEILGTSPNSYAKTVTAMIMGSLGLGGAGAEIRTQIN